MAESKRKEAEEIVRQIERSWGQFEGVSEEWHVVDTDKALKALYQRHDRVIECLVKGETLHTRTAKYRLAKEQ